MKRYAPFLFVAFSFSYLLFFPQEALEAAQSGLLLWYRCVLPVLFPFMILSGLMVRLRIMEQLPGWLLWPVRKVFRCSACGSFAIVSGFLCGFPMGARVTSDLHRQGAISGEEARYLYGFTNNVSPAFLVSFLANGLLGRPQSGCYFLLCVLGASLLYGIATRPGQPFPSRTKADPPQGTFSFGDIDACIGEAVSHTVRLGAYITVFSLLSAALESLLPKGSRLGFLLAACLEITAGTQAIRAENLAWSLQAPLLCAACAFGGLSALAQTVGIADMDRGTALRYAKSRVIITLLAASLSFGVLFLGTCLRLRGGSLGSIT